MGRTLLLLTLLVIVPRAANACGCYNTNTVLDDYEQSDIVIVARLKAIKKGAKMPSTDPGPRRASFAFA